MKDISIQYPDGRFHTVSVYRFYSVMYNGREEYVIEYDDLSDNVRGCFSILGKENNIFVKRPLENSAAYRVFYNSIRFMYKKPQALYLLPNTINLCRSALEALVPFAPPVQEVKPSVRTQVAAAGSPPPPPPGGGGGSNPPSGNPPMTSTANSTPNDERSPKKPDEVIVYEDISSIREDFPFYLTREVAARYGLKVDEKPYYHLKKAEFDVISRYAIVKLEKRELAILPQKRKNVNKKSPVNNIEPLNAKEIETLEGLFEGLMDFEDYYSFFGIEGLRNSSIDLVLNSPRIIALTKLFNKGIACGNDLAINLSEFMEGFLNDLKQKSKKF